jgi:membrane fusion protein, multidrug efflux system
MNERRIIATCLLGALGLTSGCGDRRAADPRAGREAKPVPVATAVAATNTVPVKIRAIGTVEAEQRVTLRAEVGGMLTQVGFREGDDVKAGQLLFSIDPRTYEADLKRVEATLARDQAQLENAQRQAKRYQELAQKDFVAKSQYDEVLTGVEVLKSTINVDREAIAFARLQLDRTSIKAPLAGRTGSLMAHIGDVIKANDTTLATVNQMRPIRVGFAVPAVRLPEIQQYSAARALPVVVRTSRGASAEHRGVLCFTDNQVDRDTGTIMLKGEFANEDGALWPGQFVDVDLLLAPDVQAVTVPSQAVQTGQAGQFVFVVKADTTVEKRSVEVERLSDGLAVIASGIAAGESVVTDGQLRLVPGAKVSVRPGEKREGAAP